MKSIEERILPYLESIASLKGAERAKEISSWFRGVKNCFTLPETEEVDKSCADCELRLLGEEIILYFRNNTEKLKPKDKELFIRLLVDEKKTLGDMEKK